MAWTRSQTDLGKSQLTNLLDCTFSGKINCKLSDQETLSNNSLIASTECRVFTSKYVRTLVSGHVHEPVDAWICQLVCASAAVDAHICQWPCTSASAGRIAASADVQSSNCGMFDPCSFKSCDIRTCYHLMHVIVLNFYSEDHTRLWLPRRLRVTKLHRTADMRSLAAHYQWFNGRR